MTNPYTTHYVTQVGSGIARYAGLRVQRGSGFWSKAWGSAILPGLKFLGKRLIGTAADVATDTLAGQDFREAAKSRLTEQGRDVVGIAANRAKRFAQTGKGKRKHPTTNKRTKKTKRDIF